MSLYTRQNRMRVKLPDTACVIGVGGVGTWVAVNAAMLGVRKLLLFDSDILERHNLNRLPYTEDDLGKNKARVCKELIGRLRPDALVIAFPNIDEFSLTQLEGHVFICTDTVSSQNMIRHYCRDKGLPFLRLGYDGRHFTIENRLDAPSLWGKDTSGLDSRYTIVPSYLLTPQLLALLALTIVDMGAVLTPVDISANIFHVAQELLLGNVSDDTVLQWRDPNMRTIILEGESR